MAAFVVMAVFSDKGWVFPPGAALTGAIFSLGIFAVIGWAGVIPLLCHFVRRQWQMGNELLGSIQSTFLSQGVVDSKLQRLAKDFDILCRKQIRFQSMETAPSELDALANRISAVKSAFWTTHELAANLGFKTRKRVHDYLK
ncbi:hypothetical protein HY412_01925 [Candidatus Kaiserbacteria bacterium]|nr:hypothetical protein [Candidatus Kaiserbacteria bacterium]